MHKVIRVIMVLAIVGLCAISAVAGEDNSGFEIRLSYVSGIMDMGDWFEEHLERQPGVIDAQVFVMPVGMSFSYEWDMDDIADGAFVYVDLGPAALGLGDITFWMVPVGAGVGYQVRSNEDVSFYGKLGLRHPFAGGDTVDSTSAGLCVTGGVEFGQPDNALWFVEAGIDQSSVSFSDDEKNEDIELGFTLSIGLKFN